MIKIKLLLLLLFIGLNNASAQSIAPDSIIHIIPEPVSVKIKPGYFSLTKSTTIISPDTRTRDIAEMMKTSLYTSTRYHIAVKNYEHGRGNSLITILLNKVPDTLLGDEGYKLVISQKQILISANKVQGLFYGGQSLIQLLPTNTEDGKHSSDSTWNLPCVEITDYPRFEWRGMMLDVSRHFFSKKFVMKYIAEISRYKYNKLHLHLTDDQGWRIEIKGFPNLTKVGAWRVPRTGNWTGAKQYPPPQPGEKATYGGYYTQEDIKEIVAYAQEHFVSIIPEIDIPAHSLALIAAYPNLSCTKLQYLVNPLSPQTKAIDGKDQFPYDQVLCPSNDSTWMVLDSIFSQIARIFPGKYIHVGGDEVDSSFWKKDPKDSALMKQEGISTLNGLRCYFETRLEKLITSKGKKMIGWDEISDCGLDSETTVMSWRGMAGGIEAAKMGHHVIMTPGSFCYLDHCQGDPLVEPACYSMLRLKTCYEFEPVPKSVNPKYILGGQGNLWTADVPNYRDVNYMTWPRALALAEIFWSPKNRRDWDDFVKRVQYQFKYFDNAEVNYSKALYDPIISGIRDQDGSLHIKLATEISGLEIYYRFDGTNPDKFSPRYKGRPLDIPKGATEIRVIAYSQGKPISHQINCPVSLVATRVEKQ